MNLIAKAAPAGVGLMQTTSDPGQRSAIDWLHHWANVRPDAAAFTRFDGQQSYAQLWQGVQTAAAWLDQAGVRQGDTVACAFELKPEQSIAQIELMYGLFWLGAVALPLYPGTAPAQASRVMAQFGARWLISSQAAAALNEAPPASTRLAIENYQLDKAVPRAPAPRKDRSASPFIAEFSSGTTGEPKAVLFTDYTYLATIYASARLHRWQADEVLLPALRWPSKVGLRGLLRALVLGVTHADEPFPETRSALTHLVNTLGVTFVGSSPWQLRRLLQSYELTAPALATPPAHLRGLTTAGAMIQPDEVRRVRAAITANFYVVYAATEVGVVARTAPEDRADGRMKLMDDVQVQAVDENGLTLPAGASGCLRIRTPWICAAYASDPAQAMPARPQGFIDGWFYASDIGSVDANGYLILGGRADDAINVGGMKIQPGEVEAALEQYPAIANAALVGVPDAMAGEVAVAFVVLKSRVDEHELHHFLTQRLSMAQIPAHLFVVNAIPRNAEGKILREVLRQSYLVALQSTPS